MDQKDKQCKCSLSFFSAHRVSKCSLTAKKKTSAVIAAPCKTETLDNSSTTGSQSDAKSVATADQTVELCDQKRAVRVTTSSNDDDLQSMLSTVFCQAVTDLGTVIETPECNTPEQQALAARLGNQKCDCPMASRFPHRKVKCKFDYLCQQSVKDLDSARSTAVTDGVVVNTQVADSKQCNCIGSRLEPHRREKCLFKYVAECVSSLETVSVTVTTTSTVSDNNSASALALEKLRDVYSIGCGFERVCEIFETPNADGCDDNDNEDAFSAISEDEFVEYVTVLNKTYTAEEVREKFESMQREINMLKMAHQQGAVSAQVPDASDVVLDVPSDTVCHELPTPPLVVG